MNSSTGKTSQLELTALYIVATPIGNLGDISGRALDVLQRVDLILAEDTRHTKRLLAHYGINTALKSCHEHNESQLVDWVARQLESGQSLALVSDAGTPLISDPGYVMVSRLREMDHTILSVPGPSSIIAALSIAGLPSDAFIYDGFLPNKSAARRTALTHYLSESRTSIVLESSHRIKASLRDIVEVLGTDRVVVVARELTKRFETVLSGPASDVLTTIEADADQQKGEFVVLIKGVDKPKTNDADVEQTLRILLAELPAKQAATIAAKLTGRRKNALYDLAISLKDQS